MHTKLTTAASRPGHRAGTDRTRATHTLLRLLARRVQSLQGFWLATLRDDAELEQAVKVVTNKMSFDQAMELVRHPERRGQTPSLSVSLLRFILALAFALARAHSLAHSLALSLSLSLSRSLHPIPSPSPSLPHARRIVRCLTVDTVCTDIPRVAPNGQHVLALLLR